MSTDFFPASFAAGLTLLAKVLAGAGAGARWIGCGPDTRQRVYFANHTSHLDTLILWASLHPAARELTRPVAARDYWMANRARRYLARKIFRAVFVERQGSSVPAANPLEPLLAALSDGRCSLILFPEGSRRQGPEAGPFKSGLYYLAKLRPDVEFVPARIRSAGAALAEKGRWLSGLSFGKPVQLEPGEEKYDFLARARAAVNGL